MKYIVRLRKSEKGVHEDVASFSKHKDAQTFISRYYLTGGWNFYTLEIVYKEQILDYRRGDL